MRFKFTKTAIKEKAQEGPKQKNGDDHTDTETKGLGCRVYEGGRIRFWVRYKTRAGQRRRQWIGTWGEISLEDAKEFAGDRVAEARLGADPAKVEQNEKAELGVAQWIAEYLKDVRARKKKPREDELYLGRATKRWGNLPVSELTPRKIKAANFAQRDIAIKRLEDKNAARVAAKLDPVQIPKNAGQTAANRFFASLRACLQAAVDQGHLLSNPAAKVKAPFKENPPRARNLSDDELTAVLKALETIGNEHTRAAFKLLLATGARTSEVLRATWADIDMNEGLWRIPSPKSGKPQVVPLTGHALAILQQIKRVGPYVIPGRDPMKPRHDLRRAWVKICEEAKIEGANVHDLRRTFGRHVARRASLEVASKLLRHADVRVTQKVYADLTIDDLREELEKSKPGTVVPIKKGQADAK